MTIYPSILTNTVFEVQSQVDRIADEAGDLVQTVQIDVIDGEFADNFTVTPEDLHEIEWHGLQIDFHLMVNEPMDFVAECLQFENVRCIIAQVEHMSYQSHFIEEVIKHERAVGLSLDVHTPVDAIEPESWEHLTAVQFMGNLAGVQGQPFAGEFVLQKIREVASIKREKNLTELEILVDIGVTPETIPALLQAGATGGAPGSVIWKSPDAGQMIRVMLGGR